jgi:hypothetical protein
LNQHRDRTNGKVPSDAATNLKKTYRMFLALATVPIGQHVQLFGTTFKAACDFTVPSMTRAVNMLPSVLSSAPGETIGIPFCLAAFTQLCSIGIW